MDFTRRHSSQRHIRQLNELISFIHLQEESLTKGTVGLENMGNTVRMSYNLLGRKCFSQIKYMEFFASLAKQGGR